MNDNIFLYGGPDEDPRIKKPKDDEEEGPVQISLIPKIVVAPLQEEKFNYVIAQIIDHLATKEKKKSTNLDAINKEFEEAYKKIKEIANSSADALKEGKLPQAYYPVFFGTDRFEGFQYILKQMKSNNCHKDEITNFRGRVANQAQFVQVS